MNATDEQQIKFDDNLAKAVHSSPRAPKDASVRSIRYCRDLLMSRKWDTMLRDMPTPWAKELSKLITHLSARTDQEVEDSRVFAQSTISKFIDNLKTCPPADQNLPKSFVSGTAPVVALEDGMYRSNTGHIYKVYHTVNGANQQVAKRLMIRQPKAEFNFGTQDVGPVEVYFKYEGKAPLAFLKPSMRLTLEQAREFGALYGTCCMCGKTLTNELSIALGIGPVCGNREFGGDFTFMLNRKKQELGL